MFCLMHLKSSLDRFIVDVVFFSTPSEVNLKSSLDRFIVKDEIIVSKSSII